MGICGMGDLINIGSARTAPSYVGLAPGVVGVYQINFQIPAAAGIGDLPLSLTRSLVVYPFGACLGSGLGDTTLTDTSRGVVLPVR